MPPFLGIEIGGTKLQIVAGDESARITHRRRFDVAPAKAAEGIRSDIECGLKELLPVVKPVAVGVGFGGPVGWRTGKIACSHQVEGWSDFAIADWLVSLTSVPVFVDNDANVAALGEALHGAGAGLEPVFYVTLGSGVGGGLVVDGSIYHGAKPGESEIGHMRLDKTGTILESRCSGWAVDKRIREATAKEQGSALAELIGSSRGGEAKHLRAAFDRNDRLARQIVEEVADDLAFALSHVVHLFHPQIVVIGGGLSLVGDPLQSAVARALSPLLMDVFAPGPKVSLAKLGEDSVPVGALALANARFTKS